MTIIGMKKNPFEPRKGLKRGGPIERKKGLRKVSKKQRRRTETLKGKLAEMLSVQHEIYGTERCERGFSFRNMGLKADCSGDLVADHVGTRNQDDADRYENLQVLCWGCNSAKGSKRGDYRPAVMRERMKELDAKP